MKFIHFVKLLVEWSPHKNFLVLFLGDEKIKQMLNTFHCVMQPEIHFISFILASLLQETKDSKTVLD